MRSEDERAADEATFREASGQIRSARRKLDPALERVPYLCECDDVHSREPIPLTEYERVRSDGRTGVVAKGHEFLDFAPAEVARETNPRS